MRCLRLGLVWLGWVVCGCSPAPRPATVAAAPRPAPAPTFTIDQLVSGTAYEGPNSMLDTITTGAEPRRALRYELCAGCQESATVVLGAEYTVRYLSPPWLPEERSSSGRFTAKLSGVVTAGAATERFRYTLAFTDAAVLEAPVHRPPFDAAAASQTAAERISGINAARAEVEIDTRGRVVSSRLDSSEPLLLELQKELLRVAVPLPNGPVGVGASWRHIGPRVLENNSWRREFATYELTALDGEYLEVSVSVRETSEPPEAVAANSRLLWFSGTRESKLKVRLNRLLSDKRAETHKTYEENFQVRTIPVRDDHIVAGFIEVTPDHSPSDP